jgi:hypothetical protein
MGTILRVAGGILFGGALLIGLILLVTVLFFPWALGADTPEARVPVVPPAALSAAPASSDQADPSHPTAAEIAQNRRERCAQSGSRCANQNGTEDGSDTRQGGPTRQPTEYVYLGNEIQDTLRCVRVDFPDLTRDITPEMVREAALLTMSKICQPLAGEDPWPMVGTMPEPPYLEYHATPRRDTRRS